MSDERGFTLIEVMVALAILALGLGAVLQSVSWGLSSAARADDIVAATLTAQSLLAAMPVEAGLDPAYRSGEGWEMEVTPSNGLAVVVLTVKAGRSAVQVTTLRPLAGR